jgi:hypothetical protein
MADALLKIVKAHGGRLTRIESGRSEVVEAIGLSSRAEVSRQMLSVVNELEPKSRNLACIVDKGWNAGELRFTKALARCLKSDRAGWRFESQHLGPADRCC